MNLKSLSGSELLERTKSLVADERRVSADVLLHLREIERRRLFAEAGFSSLFSYCVEELRYSEGAAYRRINAMRLLRECPEIEESIRDGSLSVSSASEVQRFVTKKPCSLEEKSRLAESVKGKSKRECEKIFEAIAPESAETAEIEVSADLLEKLKRIQALTGHQNKNLGEVLDWMADKILQKIEPKPTSPGNEAAQQSSVSRYVPASMKREVWTRDRGRCGYVDPKTGRRCDSTYALQLDHVIPYAKGGLTELRNLRLLCRTHNQYYAIQSFGLRTMSRYLTQG